MRRSVCWSIVRQAINIGRSADAGIDDLYRSSEGIVTFDPTLSRALLLAEDRETLLEHLRKGGWWPEQPMGMRG